MLRKHSLFHLCDLIRIRDQWDLNAQDVIEAIWALSPSIACRPHKPDHMVQVS